jgi:hypothetical protein
MLIGHKVYFTWGRYRRWTSRSTFRLAKGSRCLLQVELRYSLGTVDQSLEPNKMKALYSTLNHLKSG